MIDLDDNRLEVAKHARRHARWSNSSDGKAVGEA